MSITSGRARIRLIAGILLLTCNFIYAQSSLSPYSALGIGEIIQPYLITNSSMGGLSIAYPNTRHFNLLNPALLGVRESFTTFEAGYGGEVRSISQDTLKQKNGSGNLLYFGISFPIKRGIWSTGFALTPYSYADYNIKSTASINGKEDEEVMYNFKGDGGLNSVSWSHGIKITKNFSLGAKASYIFGNFNNETIIELNQTNSYNSAIRNLSRVRDFYFGFGAVYRFNTGPNSSMYLGGIYDFQTDLNATVNELLDRKQKGTGSVLISDTIINNLKTKIVLPAKYGIGISYVKGIKWLIGADFITQKWDNYEFLDDKKNTMANSYRTNLGFEIIPDANSVSSYFKRIIYRTGFYYEMTPYKVNKDQIYDFGINFGVSLPVGQASLVNLALQYGQRDGSLDTSISESYFRISLGLTVNDVWFYRRKIE